MSQPSSKLRLWFPELSRVDHTIKWTEWNEETVSDEEGLCSHCPLFSKLNFFLSSTIMDEPLLWLMLNVLYDILYKSKMS